MVHSCDQSTHTSIARVPCGLRTSSHTSIAVHCARRCIHRSRERECMQMRLHFVHRKHPTFHPTCLILKIKRHTDTSLLQVRPDADPSLLQIICHSNDGMPALRYFKSGDIPGFMKPRSDICASGAGELGSCRSAVLLGADSAEILEADSVLRPFFAVDAAAPAGC